MSTDQDGRAGRTVRVLLDVRFRSRATPLLLPALYCAVLVFIALGGVSTVVAAAVQAWWLGLVAIVVVPIAALLATAVVRVGFELIWVTLDLHEYVEDIADRFPHVEKVVDELARDMPKLGFLRRGPGGRERVAAEPEKIG
jgi:hypothetical protein